MYHFVKFNNTWYLKVESVQDISDHFKKVCGREIEQGWNDFKDNTRIKKDENGNNELISRNHSTSVWRNVVELTMQIKGDSWMNSANELETRTYKDRINHFLKGDLVYLTDGLPYFVAKEEPKYDEELFSDELKYPYKFDFEEVRFLQWPNGIHWYAKIGNIDIVDKYGNQKWRDKYYAMEVAKKFCKCGGNWKMYQE